MPSFQDYFEDIGPDWFDEYGHVNEARYAIPFTNAMWPMQEVLGLDLDYTDRTGNAIYSVEAHTRFLNEIRYPVRARISNLLIDFDQKRLWTGHIMHVEEKEVATFERLSVNYNQPSGEVVPFPEATLDVLGRFRLPTPPPWVERIGCHRRSTMSIGTDPYGDD